MVERSHCSKTTIQEDKLCKAVRWGPKSEDTYHMSELYDQFLNANGYSAYRVMC